jgi:hypothetical protein
VRENRTHGSIGGRWRNGTLLRGLLVPGRRLEYAATMTWSGPQPQQRSAEPAAYLTDRGRLTVADAGARFGAAVAWRVRVCVRVEAAVVVGSDVSAW